MAKKTTLDDLARMMKKGFDETASKKDMAAGFKEVDEQFNIVDKHLNEANERLDKIEKRVARMDSAIFVDHRRRIQKLEADVELLKDVAGIK
ncbi:hypothetical protein A3C75_00170 [Candidatus Giovannonibacteria bacterium RIFCSPHIGHO2_02_FULL_44_31]|nr:MAG: hypothetical protein A3C75_00170 [Candidatus Giovannonibacteria bacterium RIFCSPHIGHO2_02_FULL_44_31]OGF75932.1 MAG: hypothetical protein A3E62_00490 [Candidatus Giovannonibacteria bacterium RIFCSPHIGHO2_12_FULL_44_29]